MPYLQPQLITRALAPQLEPFVWRRSSNYGWKCEPFRCIHNTKKDGETDSFEESKREFGMNKQRMSGNMYAYILEHTREPSILKKLREETSVMFPQAAHMAVSPDQGAFLGWLVSALDCRRVIEVGVFTGYSSLAMALSLPSDGQLYACDRDHRALEMAQRYWSSAGLSSKITALLGPAQESLQNLIRTEPKESFDFAFVDADKRGYQKYLDLLLQLLRPGGVIVFDNVLWYGKVADESVTDKTTVALRELNDNLVQDSRLGTSLIPVGDGLFLCWKRKDQ